MNYMEYRPIIDKFLQGTFWDFPHLWWEGGDLFLKDGSAGILILSIKNDGRIKLINKNGYTSLANPAFFSKLTGALTLAVAYSCEFHK